MEEDERALALAEIDPTKVRLEHMLRNGEELIEGEEKLNRLKGAGLIRLDAKVLQALLENPECIPESWKKVSVRGTPSFK